MDVSIACPCPPKNGQPRHITDTVTLRDSLDFHAATTIRKAIGLEYLADRRISFAEILAVLTEFYLLFGITAWTLTDEQGEPVVVSKAAIRDILLVRPDVTVIADVADELYQEAVMLPLLAAVNASSPPTPTDGSISPATTSPKRSRRPSSPSSTTTSTTGGIGTITSLPVGASNSSPSSRSAR